MQASVETFASSHSIESQLDEGVPRPYRETPRPIRQRFNSWLSGTSAPVSRRLSPQKKDRSTRKHDVPTSGSLQVRRHAA